MWIDVVEYHIYVYDTVKLNTYVYIGKPKLPTLFFDWEKIQTNIREGSYNSKKYLNLKKIYLFSFPGLNFRFASLHFCKQYPPTKINIY